MNPIYIEYYTHAGADCYKVDLPWSKLAKETMVLCTVAEGLEKAQVMASMVLGEHIGQALARPITPKRRIQRSRIMSAPNTTDELESSSAMPGFHSDATKYQLGEIMHDEAGAVSHGCRSTYLLLSRDPWSHADMPYGPAVQMAWSCVQYQSLPPSGVPSMGAAVVEMFEQDLDRLQRCGRIAIPTTPSNGNA